MHKTCGDDVNDANAFPVVQMPDVRVLASHVSLADDVKPPQDANAKAERQAAKQKKQLEVELKNAQDRSNYQSMEFQQVLSFQN